ncbi:MAG: hypothetical protein U9N87_04905 [Planctomycetota bacterium]|nr:hypothetical protein [Planctomycetota bacterium]
MYACQPSVSILFDRFIAEYPDDFQIAQAYLQHAESLAHEGQLQPAIEAFQKSLDAQRTFPNLRTQAWLLYPWLIVEHELEDMYAEANAVLDEFHEDTAVSFPIEEYRFFAVRSLLAQHKGDLAAAQSFAKRAMDASTQTHSSYRYHPDIGLVQSLSGHVHERLAAMSSI